MKRFILTILCSLAIAAPFVAQRRQGELASLIQEGKRTAAFEMVRSGADVNEAQLDGSRPIHWAVYRVDYELMAELIAKKAKVDVANELGYTPLAEAIRQGDARMVKMLLDGGAGPEGANLDGQTALMTTIKSNDSVLFQILIDAGAKVNVTEKVQDQTPLMWAAANSRVDMLRTLIAKGANVNARAKYNDWPSQITSEPRAQYHSYGGLTPLLYASRAGCYTCIEALVAAGADVNLPAPEGITPMMIAIDNNHNDAAKYFLEHGGNPHIWDVYGRTALYIAVDKAGGGGGGGGGAAGGGGGGRGGGRLLVVAVAVLALVRLLLAAPVAAVAVLALVRLLLAAPVADAVVPARAPLLPAVAAEPELLRVVVVSWQRPRRRVARAAQAVPVLPAAAAPEAALRAVAQAPHAAAQRLAVLAARVVALLEAVAAALAVALLEAVAAVLAVAVVVLVAEVEVAEARPVSSMEMINLLLAAGVDPNPPLTQRRPNGQGGRFSDPLVSTGTTPLMRALILGNQEVARLLLEKGANPNIYGMGLSPFLYVAGITSGTGGRGGGNANTAMLDLMLQKGADVNARVTGAASYSGRIARASTGAGNNPISNEGITALHAAVQSGNATLVKYLLDHGARTDILDGSGRTVFDVLNGVPALTAASFAETDGLISREAAAAAAALAGTAAPRGGGGGAPRGGGAGSQEIRTLLQAAASTPPK